MKILSPYLSPCKWAFAAAWALAAAGGPAKAAPSPAAIAIVGRIHRSRRMAGQYATQVDASSALGKNGLKTLSPANTRITNAWRRFSASAASP